MALDKLVDSTQLDGALTATANAIRSKTGSSNTIAWDETNGFKTAIEAIGGGAITVETTTDTSGGEKKNIIAVDISNDTVTAAHLEQGYTAHDATGAAITGTLVPGGGGGTGTDVLFYDDLANDCRGGVVYSYSAAEFAALTRMPNNPDHSDFTTHGISIPMTSQGWNWSLADAKAYVAKYGKLNIGQTYVPTDGKSHYICYVPEDAPIERWNTEIDIKVNSGTINWQVDNGTSNTANGNLPVTFSSVGWHDVKIEAPSGVTYYPYYGSTKTNELKGKLQRIIQVFCGNNVKKMGYSSFYFCHNLASITIPDGVTSIGSNAFTSCHNLASITIPDGVTSIGDSAFGDCYSLTSLTIPDGITSIDTYTFADCYSLTSLTIPDGVTSIGGSAFSGCYSLASLTIPESVTSISTIAFNNCCSLTSLTIPDSITSIGSNAFNNCYSLASLTIPESVTSIGSNAFNNCCSLTSLTIPDGVTSISTQAFQNCCGLTSITIPNGVTIINNYTFNYCTHLTSLTILDGVTRIGNYAFSSCFSLTSITIPDGVTSIGSNAFNACYSLKNIIMESSTPPTLATTNAFTGLMSDYAIIVPAGSLSAYTSATNWSSVADHIVEVS